MVIRDLLSEMTGGDGLMQTAIAGVDLYRLSTPYEKQSTISVPAVCFIAQGQKNIYLGDEKITYDENRFLISSITLPVESELVSVSEEKPYLGLILHIDSLMVNELLREMDGEVVWSNRSASDEIITSCPIDDALSDSLIRLLESLKDPLKVKVLGTSLVKEVFFNILRSESGYVLRNSVLHHARANRVVPVIQFLEKHYKDAIEINDIASHAGMSPSTLHEHFKAATSLSPMQFVKSLRLHNAHSLILEGAGAGEAAFNSGYSNQAQFSREFKRHFGVTPSSMRP